MQQVIGGPVLTVPFFQTVKNDDGTYEKGDSQCTLSA
jgi:hypothetical protein